MSLIGLRKLSSHEEEKQESNDMKYYTKLLSKIKEKRK